jgi:transcriptional regulator with XRE-family HTH domain
MSLHDATDPALACALRRLRHSRGSTQEDLAHDADITCSGLARVERGETNPRWTTVMRIASALDVSLVELVAAVEDARPPEHLP